ncbi:hypothetical protein Droror1_Dr00015129 [Drosera rotundifolia]
MAAGAHCDVDPVRKRAGSVGEARREMAAGAHCVVDLVRKRAGNVGEARRVDSLLTPLPAVVPAVGAEHITSEVERWQAMVERWPLKVAHSVAPSHGRARSDLWASLAEESKAARASAAGRRG